MVAIVILVVECEKIHVGAASTCIVSCGGLGT